jgi:hypothetical protein
MHDARCLMRDALSDTSSYTHQGVYTFPSTCQAAPGAWASLGVVALMWGVSCYAACTLPVACAVHTPVICVYNVSLCPVHPEGVAGLAKRMFAGCIVSTARKTSSYLHTKNRLSC